MATYEVTKFSGGISDYDDRGIAGSFKFGSGLDIRKTVDSLSCQQALIDEGLIDGSSPSLSVSPSASKSSSPSLSPSPSPSTSTGISPSPSATPSVSISATKSASPSSTNSPSPSATGAQTTVFEDLIRFFVKCTDGYTYGFGSTGRIYRRDASAYWQKVYLDPDGAIKGAEEKPSDDGIPYLVWATDTKVKKKPIPGVANFSDTVTVAQNLQSTDWHTMKQVGGDCMIANKSLLAMLAYDNSFTNEAVSFVPGNTIKTMVERKGRIISSTANAAIDCEVPLVQVGDDGDIYFADMASNVPVKSFPGGGHVNPGGVTNEVDQVNFFEWEQTALSWLDKQSVGNMSLWGVYGAIAGYNGIYSYGRRNKNHPMTLNLEYALEVDEIGAVVTVDGTTLASYRDGSDFGVKAVDPTTKAQGIWEGLDFKAPVKKPINITKWNTVELFIDPLPSGASLEFWYKMNKTGSFIRAYVADGSTTFSTANAKKAVFRIGEECEIFQPKIIANPTGNSSPIVYRIRTTFE